MSIKTFFAKVGLALQKKAPVIYFGLGIIGVGATIALTVKATCDIQDDIQQKNTDLATLDEYADAHIDDVTPNAEYTTKDYKKDKRAIKMKFVLAVAKRYGFVAFSTILTIFFFSRGYAKLLALNGATLAALEALNKKFENYRQGVRDRYGEVVDMDILSGIKVDPESKEIILPTVEDLPRTQIIFDESSILWSKDPLVNYNTIKSLRDELNTLMYAKGFVCINDVRHAFHTPLPTDKKEFMLGQMLGWIYDKNVTDKIDFGITLDPDTIYSTYRDMGYVLDLNVDGCVYNAVVNAA